MTSHLRRRCHSHPCSQETHQSHPHHWRQWCRRYQSNRPRCISTLHPNPSYITSIFFILCCPIIFLIMNTTNNISNTPYLSSDTFKYRGIHIHIPHLKIQIRVTIRIHNVVTLLESSPGYCVPLHHICFICRRINQGSNRTRPRFPRIICSVGIRRIIKLCV